MTIANATRVEYGAADRMIAVGDRVAYLYAYEQRGVVDDVETETSTRRIKVTWDNSICGWYWPRELRRIES